MSFLCSSTGSVPCFTACSESKSSNWEEDALMTPQHGSLSAEAVFNTVQLMQQLNATTWRSWPNQRAKKNTTFYFSASMQFWFSPLEIQVWQKQSQFQLFLSFRPQHVFPICGGNLLSCYADAAATVIRTLSTGRPLSSDLRLGVGSSKDGIILCYRVPGFEDI